MPAMSVELGQGTGPLRGVRVVELAGIGPGPHACTILADLGADVIRVDRPGGQTFATGRYDVLTRGRPSVALDLKNPDAVATVLRLVETADVLVEGLRPGVTERLGLGPDDCLARNPRLVYGRMTGWGQTGPLAATAGHDLGYVAITGVLAGLGQDPRPAALPHQPARRLRRRVDVPGHRRPRRAARGPAVGSGPGRGRRHRRRRRPPQRDGRRASWPPGWRPSSAPPTCSTAAPRSTTCTRRPTVVTWPSGRWSRSSTTPWSRGSASATAHPTATTRPTTPPSGS